MKLSDPTPTMDSTPSVKHRSVGASVTLALVDLEAYNQTDETGEIRTFANGDPMTGTRLYGLVVASDGDVYVGTATEPSPANIGDLVTIWIEGSRYFSWRDAKAAFNSDFETGDLIWWALTDTAAGRNGGTRKIYSVKIGKNEEGGQHYEWKARADAAHRQRKATPVPDPTPTAAQAATSSSSSIQAPF